MAVKVAAALMIAAAAMLGLAAPEIKLYYALQKNDQPNPAHPTIVMLGDSHTSFVNWRMLLDCQNIANFGVGGNTTSQILERMPAVIAAHPKAVFIMAGTNDAIEHEPPQMILSNLAKIKSELAGHGIEPIIQTPPLLPDNALAIAEISKVASVTIPFTESDLLTDGVHLRRSGYAKWRDAITSAVRGYC